MSIKIPEGRAEVDANLSEPTVGVLEWLKKVDGDIGVLGIGGKMGTNVGQMLVRGLEVLGSEAKVYGVSRYGNAERREYHENLGIKTIQADLSKPEEVKQLPEIRNLIYLVGEKFGTSERPDRAWIQNVSIPALVCDRFRKSRFVVLSTGCVYPFVDVSGRGSVESDEPDPVGEYAYTCLGRERVFYYYSVEAGIPVSIIRLNYANEFRYGVLVDIAKRVFCGEPVDISTPYVNVIWQRDAVSRTIQCLELASSPPAIINITGPEKASVREVAESFGRIFKRDSRITGEPSKMAWLASSAYSDTLFGNPEVGLEDMIPLIGGYIQKGGETLNKPTKFEVRSGDF